MPLTASPVVLYNHNYHATGTFSLCCDFLAMLSALPISPALHSLVIKHFYKLILFH